MSENERKTIQIADLKAVGEGNGGFSGYGSVFGNVDSYGDIVVKGAFADTIPEFLKRGFNPIGHEWGGLPVAMPTAAKEDDTGLFIEAEFHSTPAAQDARTVVAERAEKGLSVGLSIGYRTEQYEMVAADVAVDQGLAQEGDPEHWAGGYRLLKKLALFEVSIVTVPANRDAEIVTVKAGTYEQAGEHATKLLADYAAFIERSKSLADLRAKEGRVLSEANRTRIEGHLKSLREIANDIEGLLVAAEPKHEELEALRLAAMRRAAALRARLIA